MEEPIYEEFVRRSVDRAKRRVLGNPLVPGVDQGPQVLGYSAKLTGLVLGGLENVSGFGLASELK